MRLSAVALGVSFLLIVACQGSGRGTDAPSDEPLAECDAYVTRLSACAAREGGEPSTAQAREALAARFKAAAKTDEAGRARTRARCVEATAALGEACP